MIKVGDIFVSDDIKEVEFVCNLEKCKGACCVEGDLGAPLEESDLEIMKAIQKEVRPYITKEGAQSIASQGPYILDEDGDYSSPTIGGKECAYALYDKQGILKCGIEQAYLDGKIGLLCLREDVGRHNAVDKVVGWALQHDRLPLAGLVLQVSGRASFELAQKAVYAGCPVLAAVSAPSSLADDLALDTGLTLIGFSRGQGFNIYAGDGRIRR